MTFTQHDRAQPPSVVVRRATRADAAAIARLHVAAWRSGYRGIMAEALLDAIDEGDREQRWRLLLEEAENPARTLIAIDGERLLGFATVGPSEDENAPADEGELRALYVDPAAWRSGVGTVLHAACLAGLRRQGCTRAVLWVLEANDRARGFYQALGWIADGASRPHTFAADQPPLPVVRYRRQLGTGAHT
jgi:GNAT superfamily N-acetyltransferase